MQNCHSYPYSGINTNEVRTYVIPRFWQKLAKSNLEGKLDEIYRIKKKQKAVLYQEFSVTRNNEFNKNGKYLIALAKYSPKTKQILGQTFSFQFVRARNTKQKNCSRLI